MADYKIAPVSEDLRKQVRAMIDAKTKPLGSLGQIEKLALNMALSQNTAEPGARTTLLLCAGDHGLVAEGVSAWPSAVTAQMVMNFLNGGAAANVFARAAGAEIMIIDAGVSSPLPDDAKLLRAGIRPGARNALKEDALTANEVEAALIFGGDTAAEAVANGADVIALGEMGIGNTSSAALLAHVVTGATLEALVGAGAGLDAAGVVKKNRDSESLPRQKTWKAGAAGCNGGLWRSGDRRDGGRYHRRGGVKRDSSGRRLHRNGGGPDGRRSTP